MELVTPSIGLVLWTFIGFIITMVLLGRIAWRPILKSVRERELNIEVAMQQAEQAREEVKALHAANQEILQAAGEYYTDVTNEAKARGEQVKEAAREKAREEVAAELKTARAQINEEKEAALAQLKADVDKMGADIAGKILRKETVNN